RHYGPGAFAHRIAQSRPGRGRTREARRTRCTRERREPAVGRPASRSVLVSWVTQLARPEIVALKAYEHAVWEPELERLHANELPWRSFADESLAGLNRYPEPQPQALVERLASLYGVAPESVLVGRGSDEAIDLLVRGFCRAGQDSVVICPPTF